MPMMNLDSTSMDQAPAWMRQPGYAMTNPFAGTEGASSHSETISSSQTQNSQGTHHGVENTSGTSDSTMESTTTTVTTPSKFK